MASPALAPTCPCLSWAEDTRAGRCTPGGISESRAVGQNHLTHPPGCATFPAAFPATPHQHIRCQSAHRASHSCSCSYGIHTHWHRGTSAFSPTLTVTSRKRIQQCLCQASVIPFSLEKDEHTGGDMPRLFPFKCDQSHNHTVHYPASPTLWLSSCMFHAWLEQYLYSYRTHCKLLKENGTQTYNNLTSGLTEGLAAQRGSVHSHGSNIYQGTDLAFIFTHCCEALQHGLPAHKVPAWIWASGAAPASTAGIHPVKAKPATSCHCSKNQ